MARPNKIWFRKDTGWWMVTLDGTKTRLAQGRVNRKLADQKFHELKAVQARPADRCDARVADVIESFLDWSKAHRSSEINRDHHYYGGGQTPNLRLASLTVNLGQSVICTFIFFGGGLGLFGHFERKWLPLFVVGVWLVQLLWSPWWLARFRFGPAEWLWRSLTYAKLQPMRPAPAPAPATELG